MPGVFEQMGVRFEYPDNWSIDQFEEEQGEEQVIVSSPNTAFWHLSKQPAEVELEELFDEALAALRTEYQDMEVEPASEQIEDRRLEGFDVRFICLDLTNTCRLRAFSDARRHLSIDLPGRGSRIRSGAVGISGDAGKFAAECLLTL